MASWRALFFKVVLPFYSTEMVSYLLRCGLQRGYLSSRRFMLSFRDIYITLSSLGVLALVLGRQSCWDQASLHSIFLHIWISTSITTEDRNCDDFFFFTASKGHMFNWHIWLGESTLTCDRSVFDINISHHNVLRLLRKCLVWFSS